jgi:hypothetical protein
LVDDQTLKQNQNVGTITLQNGFKYYGPMDPEVIDAIGNSNYKLLKVSKQYGKIRNPGGKNAKVSWEDVLYDNSSSSTSPPMLPTNPANIAINTASIVAAAIRLPKDDWQWTDDYIIKQQYVTNDDNIRDTDDNCIVIFTNGYIYAISFYVESVTTTAFLDTIIATTVVTGTSTYLKNNVAVNGATEAIVAGNTYTLIYAATLTSAISTIRIGLGASGNSTANFTISMPQMEIGVSNTASYSTSYIPTTTTALTRNADVFSRNNIYTNGLITSAGGTWFVELNNNLSLIRDGYSVSLFIDNSSGGVTNGFSIKHSTASLTLRLQIVKYISGASSIFYQTLTDIVKIAIKWNGTTADVFVNGVKQVSATAFTTTVMEYLSGSGVDVPKYIKSTYLFPTPLTDAECIALTQ